MKAFARVRSAFDVNWTTVLVGWRGLGVLSPWPNRWMEFPPLLTADEVAAYARERLAASPNGAEQALLGELLSLDLRAENREEVTAMLNRLSESVGHDAAIELRRWRLVLLEQTLSDMPHDPLYGLTALTEFWQSFGFPADSPHVVQGRGNTVSPADYYQPDNFRKLLAAHTRWIEDERAALRQSS
jgi:hypothetical protein